MAATTLPVWTLGELMEKARRDARISTKKMADVLSVTPKTINNYEQGRTKPSRAVLLVWIETCSQPWFSLDGISDLLGMPLPWITAPAGEVAEQLSLFVVDPSEPEQENPSEVDAVAA